MKKKKLTLLTTAILIGSIGTVNASLISQDLSAQGDGLLTYDSTTGLSWLDLTQTVGKTYNEVLAGFGGFTTSLGFRYATEIEFSKLLTDADITEGVSNTNDVTNINNTMRLINFFGVLTTDGHTYQSIGYISDPSSLGQGDHALGELAVNDIGRYVALSSVVVNSSFQQANQGVTGSFLVKEQASSVPEPTTMLLVGTGLAWFVGAKIKKNKIY